MSADSPLHELAEITDAILTRKAQTTDPDQLARLDAMLSRIGAIQLRIAIADADRAETMAMDRAMRGRGWTRTSLDE